MSGSFSRANLMTTEGRAAIEAFMSSYMKDELRGAPRLVYAPGFSHSDAPFKLLSIINLASVRELEKLIGKPIDPLRFRANVYVDGLEPWEDHGWVGKTIRLGSATLKGFHRIPRCTATNVDPVTGERDMEIPEDVATRLRPCRPRSLRGGDGSGNRPSRRRAETRLKQKRAAFRKMPRASKSGTQKGQATGTSSEPLEFDGASPPPVSPPSSPAFKPRLLPLTAATALPAARDRRPGAPCTTG